MLYTVVVPGGCLFNSLFTTASANFLGWDGINTCSSLLKSDSIHCCGQCGLIWSGLVAIQYCACLPPTPSNQPHSCAGHDSEAHARGAGARPQRAWADMNCIAGEDSREWRCSLRRSFLWGWSPWLFCGQSSILDMIAAVKIMDCRHSLEVGACLPACALLIIVGGLSRYLRKVDRMHGCAVDRTGFVHVEHHLHITHSCD